MTRFAILLLLVLAWLFGFSDQARAEQAAPARQTVVMVVDPEVMPVARRLRQEIEALGLAVRVMFADASQAASLKNEALAADAVAAIHLAPVGGGDVDMTIVDGATGKTVSWKIAASTPDEPAPLDLIATRTVELLRASLLELAARRKAATDAATRPRPAPAITPPPAESPRDIRGSLSLVVGPALLYSPHFRPGALLQSGLVWLPWPHLGVSLAALVPIVAVQLNSPQGTVDAFASLYRLGPALQVGAATAPVTLRCAAGLEFDVLRFEGKALPPYQSATDTRRTRSPFAGASARFRVATGWYVVADLMAELAFPSTTVRIAGSEVSSWGRPLATASIGVELALPTAGFR